MTIDEAIAKHKIMKKASELHNDKRGAFYSAEEHEQIAEWLEELKELRKIKEDYAKGMQTSYATFMYNKALDDFLEKLIRISDTLAVGNDNTRKYLILHFKEIAEQLRQVG